MSQPNAISEEAPEHAPSHRRGVILVCVCTLVGATAQILMKMGADYSVMHPGIEGMMTNLALLGGYALYGLTTVLMVLAFKDGELGVLYPIISLSYVWVTLLSPVFFHDNINAFKIAGVITIICGVAILGRSAQVTPAAPVSTPASSVALVLLASLIGSYGMVFLKKASKDLHISIFKMINMQFVIGVTLFLISSVFYILGIRHGQISVLYPTVSLSYVWALVWGKLVFGEPFTSSKVVGLGLVLAGVVLVQLGS